MIAFHNITPEQLAHICAQIAALGIIGSIWALVSAIYKYIGGR